jgi:hypothetical protein
MFRYRKHYKLFIYVRYIIVVTIILSLLHNRYRSLLFHHEQPDTCANLCPYASYLTHDSLVFNKSHRIRHFPNFVCPQNFRNLADWVYGWPDQFEEHMQTTASLGRLIAPCLPSGSIIYVSNWDIAEFFDTVYPYLINKFVLVTGEGDLSSPETLEHLQQSDSKIIHWFGQNGKYPASTIDKFTHIPIGK